MGVVYEAVHETIGQRAAVKLLLADASRVPSYVERFLREARVACAVRHPGLVQVFDSGQLDDGAPFLLMELIDGESLRARLVSRPKPAFEEAVRLTAQLASALAAVHKAGIIHRDVKPENIMLIADDAVDGGIRAKLLDFGIARSGRESTPLTVEGAAIGTPRYMAPEQCVADGVVTTGVDVYSLGIVLFEMLAGVPPFVGDASTVMRQHLIAEPPLHSVVLLPRLVRELLADMLAKAPSRRPSAAECAVRLAEARGALEHQALSLTEPRSTVRPYVAPTPSPTPRARRAALLSAALASAACVVAFVAGFLYLHRHGKGGPLPENMVRLRGGTFTMGRTAAEADAECVALGSQCRRDVIAREQPQRTVYVDPFALDVNEVTNEAFARWMNGVPWHAEDDPGSDTPCRHAKTFDGVTILISCQGSALWYQGDAPRLSVEAGFENRPAVGVTWDGARMYCSAQGKRLPTEAEWEFAARGFTARRFPWGDSAPRCEDTAYGRDEGLPCHGLEPRPANVGGSPQDWTPEGVHDLFGNVQEWVEDAFTRPSFPDCGDCRNPVVEPSTRDPGELRVVRGGAWSNSIFGGTSARARWIRNSAADGLGFRCAFTEQ
jgi:formylglycine-generating enzyme required for sulfatase activity